MDVCVLFADVRDFTPYAEQRTPEEVIEVVNGYLTALTDTLYRHGGLLDKYTGDGLMALFRVGGEPAHDVANAVRAALAMSRAADEVSAGLEARGDRPLPIGISVHYGEAVVGLVGNPNQFNYTALGYTVNIAARLQALAVGGEVVVSQAVGQLVEDRFEVEALEPVTVKGVSQPVRPYRVVGPKPSGGSVAGE
jgi:adenylate cyclase